MSNLFQEVLGDLDNVEQELLGPDYQYFKQIRTPGELGCPAAEDWTHWQEMLPH